MKKQRQKQIGIDAVVKVQNFLQTAKDKIDKGELFSLANTASSMQIDRMIATLSVRNGYFEKGVVKGEYKIGDNWAANDTAAKKLIELVRLSKIDSSQSKIAKEIVGNPATGETLNEKVSNTIDQAVQLLRKENRQVVQYAKQTGIFDAQEKEFDDKLKIACAIASGCYVQDSTQAHKFSYPHANDFIVSATNDLYKKLKNNV